MLTQSEKSEPRCDDSEPHIPAASIFANRNFCLLLLGSSLSLLGDQFTVVALPWLVLNLTGDAAALGFVLAAIALPRALLILIGGAIVDRMSPRRVLLIADVVNAVLVAVLATLVLTHDINIQVIYVLAVGIGLATAFSFPASTAMLPQLVRAEQLQTANSLDMGISQACTLLGPAIAGLVITFGSATRPSLPSNSLHGIGLALSIDAGSFVFSLVSLLMIRVRSDNQVAAVRTGGLLADIAIGLRAVHQDSQLRAFLLYGAAVSAFLGGSLQVGLPVLAGTHPGMGATSLGLLMTSIGIGFLGGSMLSGVAVRAIRGRVGILWLASNCIAGVVLAALSLVNSTAGGVALLLLMGVLQGISQVPLLTWIQRRVSEELMGRTMSIVMFVFTGTTPIAAVAAGALLNSVSVGTLFAGAGLGLLIVALLCIMRAPMRQIHMAE